MLSIKELLYNVSKGQSGIPLKYVIQRLDQIYEQMKPKIIVRGTREEEGGTFVYLSVPSEDMKKEYDVCFWFDTTTRVTKNTKLKLYTNSPHFGFSYAYIFNKKKSLLWPELYPNKIITMAPKIRNPYQAVGFDKHVWAGMKYIISEKLINIIKRAPKTKKVKVTDFEGKLKHLKRIQKKNKK